MIARRSRSARACSTRNTACADSPARTVPASCGRRDSRLDARNEGRLAGRAWGGAARAASRPGPPEPGPAFRPLPGAAIPSRDLAAIDDVGVERIGRDVAVLL